MKSERNCELCINKKRLMIYQILNIFYKIISFIWIVNMIMVIVFMVMFVIGSLSISLEDIQRGIELSTKSIIETQPFAKFLNTMHFISYSFISVGVLTILNVFVHTIRLMVVKRLNSSEMRKLGIPIMIRDCGIDYTDKSIETFRDIKME